MKGAELLPGGHPAARPANWRFWRTSASSSRASPPPRASCISTTGAELVDPEGQPATGRFAIRTPRSSQRSLRERGADLVSQSRCGDDLATIVARGPRRRTAVGWDLLLISGGASVGDHDFGARALRELGFTLHFDRINLRPGKPLIFASRGTQLAFVFPGNPVSHFVTFHLAIAPRTRMSGRRAADWPLAEVEMAEEIAVTGERRET